MPRSWTLYFVIVIGGAVIAAVPAVLFMRARSNPRPPPNIAPLRDILEKSASEALPPPQLSTGSININTTQEKLASELDRVTGLARQLQGAAMRSADEDGNAKLLVQLPADNAEKFSEMVTGKPGAARENQKDATVFIDVVFHPAPPAAGEPSR